MQSVDVWSSLHIMHQLIPVPQEHFYTQCFTNKPLMVYYIVFFNDGHMIILRCCACFDASFCLPQKLTWVVLCEEFMSTVGVTEVWLNRWEIPPAFGPLVRSGPAGSAPSFQDGAPGRLSRIGTYPLLQRWKYDNEARRNRTETMVHTFCSGKYPYPFIFVILQKCSHLPKSIYFHFTFVKTCRLGEMFADCLQKKPHWDITWHHINSGAVQFFWPPWDGPAPSLGSSLAHLY